MRWLGPALVVAGLLAAAAACSDETIVLATIPEEPDGGTSSRQKCHTNDDCQGEYCQIDNADDSVPSGHCAHKPFECTDDKFSPVCAIYTGISYYNDCYRKAAGESFSVPGDCDEHARPCNLVGKACPFGTVCSLLGLSGEPGAAACGMYSGTCWGQMPCPKPDDDDHGFRWNECSTRDGALRCVDACTALQTGQPFVRAKAGSCK